MNVKETEGQPSLVVSQVKFMFDLVKYVWLLYTYFITFSEEKSRVKLLITLCLLVLESMYLPIKYVYQPFPHVFAALCVVDVIDVRRHTLFPHTLLSLNSLQLVFKGIIIVVSSYSSNP